MIYYMHSSDYLGWFLISHQNREHNRFKKYIYILIPSTVFLIHTFRSHIVQPMQF